MQRPPLLEADGFCFWKIHFETYIMSKDIDLWQVIQNGDFYFEIEDSETKMMNETSYELLKDNQKKQLSKNNEAKMTPYNALPRKEYKCVFMCKTTKEVWHTLIITHQGNSQVKNCKINLLTQEYKKFSISHQETIDSGFTRFNAIRAKVTVIKEAKELATLPLDELIGNLKVYEMILASDGVTSKPIKEKVMPIALKANVTRGQTSNDNNGNRIERENCFGNGGDRFDKGHGNRIKGVGSSRGKHNCYGCGRKNHFVDDCPKVNMKKALVGGTWSDSEDGDQMEKDATCLMAIGSQNVNLNPSQFDNNVNELQNNYNELVKINFEITNTNESLLKEKSILEQERIRFIKKSMNSNLR
ncbi:putative reverse transcriptase domain-containing protein [Tanacetum coccineum]